MKNLITYITIAVLLTACSKNNNNKQVTVTGRLMQSCDAPAANKNGIIRLPGGGFLNNPSTSLEFTTDENGYFKVTHNKSFSEFSVRTSANHSVLEASISGDEKELGEVYLFPPSARYYLYLDATNNTYTEFDTLTYSNGGWPNDGREPWLKKAGPFSSGIIDTVHLLSHINDLPMNYNKMNNNELTIKRIHFYLGAYDSSNEQISDQFSTSYCQDEYQTVILVIN